MAIPNIIKNDSQRAVVLITARLGAGEAVTVALSDLINTTNGETSSGALACNISGIWASMDSNASSVLITRNSSTILVASGIFEYPGSQQLPSIGISNGQDITITFNGKGTIVLDLRKVSGYVQPNRNIGV